MVKYKFYNVGPVVTNILDIDCYILRFIIISPNPSNGRNIKEQMSIIIVISRSVTGLFVHGIKVTLGFFFFAGEQSCHHQEDTLI